MKEIEMLSITQSLRCYYCTRFLHPTFSPPRHRHFFAIRLSCMFLFHIIPGVYHLIRFSFLLFFKKIYVSSLSSIAFIEYLGRRFYAQKDMSEFVPQRTKFSSIFVFLGFGSCVPK